VKVEKILQKHGYKPNVLLDQHFLADEKLVVRLLKKLQIKKDDIVFEVGAGIGTFTEKIPKCKKIYAVDIDKKVIAVLKAEVKREYLEVIEGNALEHISKLKFNKLVSSTPYSICEPLFHKLFVADFEKALVIVPEKFHEKVENPQSSFGFFVKMFLNVKKIEDIPKIAFIPAPKVGSVALLVTKKPQSISQELYLQKDKKVKNLLREVLCKNKKMTKKQAKKLIDEKIDNKTMLEGFPGKLKLEELEILEEFVTNTE